MLSEREYAYARVRGRMPVSKEWPNWKCYLLATGHDMDSITPADSSRARTTSTRYNRLPGVKDEIAHERELYLGQIGRRDANAWWAKVERMEGMAEGRLPVVRTVSTPAGALVLESFHETNLTALGKALEMQGKALNVFVERTELTGANGGPLEMTDDARNNARIKELLALAGGAKANSETDDEVE